MSQKKQGKDCGQTKIAIVALSPSKSEDTSTKPIQGRKQLLSVMHKLVLTPSSRPFFSCWEGRDEAVSLKKPIQPRNHVRTSMNNSFCSANMTVVGAFFSPNKQTTPISAHECCKTRGGGGARGFFVMRLPSAMVCKVRESRQWAGILPSSSWPCCPCRDGVVAVNAQVSLPSLQWRCWIYGILILR